MVSNISLFEVIVRLMIVLFVTVFALFVNMFSLYIVAMILLVTALSGYCPIYHALGINKNENQESTH